MFKSSCSEGKSHSPCKTAKYEKCLNKKKTLFKLYLIITSYSYRIDSKHTLPTTQCHVMVSPASEIALHLLPIRYKKSKVQLVQATSLYQVLP